MICAVLHLTPFLSFCYLFFSVIYILSLFYYVLLWTTTLEHNYKTAYRLRQIELSRMLQNCIWLIIK